MQAQTEVLTLTFYPKPLAHIDDTDLHYLLECLPHAASREAPLSVKSGKRKGVAGHYENWGWLVFGIITSNKRSPTFPFTQYFMHA